MTKPTTEELKDLLGKVTQGEWVVDGSEITSTDLHPMDCITGVVTRADDATLIALAPTLASEVVRLREALARRAVKDIQRLVDWLNEDEDHAELLLANLTHEEIETARQALSQK